MKKIAIIGTVPVSKHVGPYGDKSWEIWVCSPGNSQGGAPPRIDKWFELHAIVDMIGPENTAWCKAYFEWLRAQSFPIYMQERNEHVPQAIPFPRDVLIEKFGPNEKKGMTNWFTSSIAWMMAYAIHLGADEIGIFGVDMAATEEHYSWQKAGCLRFVEIAREHGITVTIPLESTLACGAPMYGYAESSRMGRSMIVREFEMKHKISELQQLQHKTELEMAFFKGALEDLTYIRRTFVSGHKDAEVDFDDNEARASVEMMADSAAQAAAVIAGSEVAMDTFAQDARTGLMLPTAPAKDATAIPSATEFNVPGSELLAAAKPKARRRSKSNGELRE